MTTVFWDLGGITQVNTLEMDKTIHGEFNVNLMNSFNYTVKDKRPHLSKKKIPFH